MSTLPACLRSLQRQIEPNWQCVLVDDGSDDGSLSYAQHIAQSDRRVVVVPLPHQGLIPTLNAGIPYCRGVYIARMDADDLMHRERLSTQAATLDAHPELSAVGCHVRLFPRRHLRDGRRAYEAWLNSLDTAYRIQTDAFVECPIAHPTLMIRRSILTDFGYHNRDWPEDYDLILRLLAARHRIGVVPRRFLGWRDRPERLSRTHPAYALKRFTACKAAYLVETFLAETDLYILWGYGATGKALCRTLAMHQKIPSYIVELHPGRLGKRIHNAPVIPPETLPNVARQPLVVSVAGATARGEIRQALTQMGFEELQDFVCAA